MNKRTSFKSIKLLKVREKQLPVMNEPISKQGNCPTISNQMKLDGNHGGTMCTALACKTSAEDQPSISAK